MNCSVRSLDSFIFCTIALEWARCSGGRATYLCPYLQHVLERHTNVRQLALQEHYDIVLVLLYLFRFVGFGGPLSIPLLHVCL